MNKLLQIWPISLQIYLEQTSNYTEYIWSDQFSAMFGAYDIDKTDTLTFFVSHPSHGNLTVSSKQTISPGLEPCSQDRSVSTLCLARHHSKSYFLRLIFINHIPLSKLCMLIYFSDSLIELFFKELLPLFDIEYYIKRL